jgi:diguanylate cyclase (GGDEF)-like protein/putative nucleotidyltransferase with HDIG domain
MLAAQDQVAVEQSNARELHRMRGVLRSAYALFLENRAEGHRGVNAQTRQTFADGLMTISTLRAANETDPEITVAVAQLNRDLDELGVMITRDYPNLQIGSPQDRATVAHAVALIDRIDESALTWATRTSQLADAQVTHLRTLTKQLVGVLAAIIGIGGLIGMFLAIGLARARTRIVGALLDEHAARGAVISSVQDGLAVIGDDGRILDMNDRLATVTGYSEAALRAATTGVPYLAGTEVNADVVGERDLLIQRPDGGTVPVILSSAPLESPSGAGAGRVHVLKDVTERKRAETELRTLAMEQTALRRAATAVASGANPEDVCSIVAREVAMLLGASGGIVSRFDRASERAVRVGSWVDPSVADRLPQRLPLERNVIATVYNSGIPARKEDTADPPEDVFAKNGFAVSIAAPVRVGSEVWGAVTAVAQRPEALPPGSDLRLARFAELVGITMANADARARLARLAATDALTGLANHRTFHERIRNEIEIARVQQTPLSLVLLDLDHFKAVNDTFGHQAGDAVLTEFGRCMSLGARYEELVARIGGEEFAWILPGSEGANALRAAERVSATFAAIEHPGIGHVTVSAGVCDLSHTNDPEELLRLADSALYWSKSHGRNRVTLYAPDVVEELSDDERASRLTRSQTKTALQTLTRLIDAKDPATARHTERVAALAAQIAVALGWTPEKITMLQEAALFHDIGKIALPDDLLLKVEPLSAAERDLVKSHVMLGVELIDDVLQPEQVSWIRNHHEHWDGTGYPDGRSGDQIPLGAQIIHVADAWDAMTVGRMYRPSRSLAAAIDECRSMAGTQFAPQIVEKLVEVVGPDGPRDDPDPALSAV